MPFTSTLPTPADGNIILGSDIALLANALHALADAWTDCTGTFTWSSSGVAPAIGNGTIVAKYRQLGKTVDYAGSITMGTTTTFGTGTWLVSLPVATYAGAPNTGAAYCSDASTAANRQAAASAFNGTTQLLFYASTGGAVTNIAPFTWATTDKLVWQVTYEVP